MSKKVLLLLIWATLCTYAHSQQGPLTNYQVVLEGIFYSDYKFAEMDIDSITTRFTEKSGRLYYVYYVSRGYKMRAEYNARLIWTLTYVFLPFEDLPRPCQRYVTENYLDKGFELFDIRYQDAPNDSYYKVDVKRGAKHLQLRFNDEGDFLKEKEGSK